MAHLRWCFLAVIIVKGLVMGLMERHIARQIGRYIVILTLGFGLLVAMIESLKLLSLVINSGVDIVTFTALLVLALPRLLSYALPWAVCIATILVFWRLQSDNELMVLRSAGLSDWRLLRAPMAVAFLVGLLLYVFLLYINPLAREHFTRLKLEAKSEFVLSLIQPGQFNVISDSVTLYIGELDDKFVMREIFLHDGRADSDLGATGQTVIAAEGKIFDADGSMGLLVRDGSQQFMRDGRLHSVTFDEYIISLDVEENPLLNRLQKPSERSGVDLLRLLFFSSGDDFSANNLGAGERVRLWVEFHERLTYPLLAPLLGLWGCYVMLVGIGRQGRLLSHPFVVGGGGGLGALAIFFVNEFLVNSLRGNIDLWFLLYLFFAGAFALLLPWRDMRRDIRRDL